MNSKAEVRGIGRNSGNQITNNERGVAFLEPSTTHKEQSKEAQSGVSRNCIPASAPPPTLPRLILPPFVNPGPSSHPQLPQSTPVGYFGHPPNVAPTTGCLLSQSEVSLRRDWLRRAMTAAQPERPRSVRFLNHYISASGQILRMQPTDFLNEPSTRFSEFLRNIALPALEQGVRRRLRDPNDPQGTLRTGQIRFIQHRDGIRPSATGGTYGPSSVGSDMATSLGAYYIHSAIWVQAHQRGERLWTVNILRWYVQVYDWYNWNSGQDAYIPVPSSRIRSLPQPPWQEVRISNYGLFKVITTRDDWFRDLEVSGGARSYLVYTSPFEAPNEYRRPLQITL